MRLLLMLALALPLTAAAEDTKLPNTAPSVEQCSFCYSTTGSRPNEAIDARIARLETELRLAKAERFTNLAQQRRAKAAR